MADVARKWPRPEILPLPQQVKGVQTPRVCLNGTWKIQYDLQENFYDNRVNFDAWQDVCVPLEITNNFIRLFRDYKVEKDNSFAYKKMVEIPAEFAGCRVMLRFDGANCYTRVWVDGHYLMDHYGGFTAWDCDITDYAIPGKSVVLTVEITGKPFELNPYNQGGLIRDVTLVAVPQTYLSRLHVVTTFDKEFKDAVLEVSTGIHSYVGKDAEITLELASPCGEVVELIPATLPAKNGMDVTANYTVKQPRKWDSEHPNLYTMTASVKVDGEIVEVVSKMIGFRQIDCIGNQIFVNGQVIKLRGVNRHDIHPVTGRAINHQLVVEDVRLFKEANVNFIRTSHYPPRPDFLEECDRVGIYVEDEIAVAFLGQTIKYTMNDPEYTQRFMGQFSEMIERDRSHPCVIMWSLANESYWGSNFREENQYAHKEDPSRPTIFSYPITMPEEEDMVDIWSLHYAGWWENPDDLLDNFQQGHSWGHKYPVLHDEYIHIPCYDLEDHKRDQGVREFYGESVKRFWDKIWEAQGSLGGAIWAGIDETNFRGGHDFPLEWGLFDGWRRRKPEYWGVKKGYSPIRVNLESIENQPGKALCIPVENRFNHTNLNEITVKWTLSGKSGEFQGPDALPRMKAELILPDVEGKSGDVLNLQFYDGYGMYIDEYNISVDPAPLTLPVPAGGDPVISYDRDGGIIVTGHGFVIEFCAQTGLICQGTVNGEVILTGGPALNLVGLHLKEWSLDETGAVSENGNAVITIRGSYGKAVEVTFRLTIDSEGLIKTHYTIDDMPYKSPRRMAFKVGTDVGGYEEVGVSYTLSSKVNQLDWNRKGLWNAYPDWSIGRNHGTAYRYRQGGDESFQTPPQWDWQLDMRNHQLFGKYDIGRRGTKDFSSQKHNILSATASSDQLAAAATALSDGRDSVRLEATFKDDCILDDRDPAIRYVGNWLPIENNFGSSNNTETWCKTAGDYLELEFDGTGVVLLNSRDIIGGIAKAYVDGNLMEDHIDMSAHMLSGTARGFEKVYHNYGYSIEGLPYGKHTLRIEVTGDKGPGSMNSYVMVDGFLILQEDVDGDVKMVINNQFNYPELTWGDYVKDPIMVETGYTDTVYLKLVKK